MIIDRLKLSDMRFIKNVESSTEADHILTSQEITKFTQDPHLKRLMILLFLTKNILLEYLRRLNQPYPRTSIAVKQFWQDIQSTLIKRLFLSRDIAEYYAEGPKTKEFLQFIELAKNWEFSELDAEHWINKQNENHLIILKVNGHYDTGKFFPNESGDYTVHDRRTGCHVGLYDPFGFHEPDTIAAKLYVDPSAQKIKAIGTLKFALPQLLVLYSDNTYIKIPAKDITDFIAVNRSNMNDQIIAKIQWDYPQLFRPPIDEETMLSLARQIQALIASEWGIAQQTQKPLLIILSEVHGSHISFLLNLLVLSIARNYSIKHLFIETINVHHAQQGWDPDIAPTTKLMSIAQKDLGFIVKDLEQTLHYEGIVSPYPYLDIPEERFGIKVREDSWIIDTKLINTHAVMIVGTGHLMNMTHSELKNSYHILPIDCSGDKLFSDMIGVSDCHFIEVTQCVDHLSLKELQHIASETLQKLQLL